MNTTEPSPGSDRTLPTPDQTGSTPLETTLATRRSHREFGPGPVSLADVSQLLWAAQGETHPDGLRAAPSAGATYPLAVQVSVAENGVPDLEPGVYRYRPGTHTLRKETAHPVQLELQRAAYDQEWVGEAPIVVAISGIEERTAREYGPRAGDLYVPMEAGHAGENLHLQAEAVGLATVPVGGFKDEAVASALDLGPERPLIMYPVGQPPSE